MAKAIHIYVHDGKRTKDAGQYSRTMKKVYNSESELKKDLPSMERNGWLAIGEKKLTSGKVEYTFGRFKDEGKFDDAEMTRIERAITEDPEGQAKVAASKKMTEQQILKDLRAYGIDINAPHVKRYIDAFRKVMKGANK